MGLESLFLIGNQKMQFDNGKHIPSTKLRKEPARRSGIRTTLSELQKWNEITARCLSNFGNGRPLRNQLKYLLQHGSDANAARFHNLDDRTHARPDCCCFWKPRCRFLESNRRPQFRGPGG